MTKIIIVGGGFAGTKLALELMNNDQFDVQLVTPHSRFEYHGAMYRSATGRSPLEVVLPFREIFAKAQNVEIVLDRMSDLRSEEKIIEGEAGTEYPYDFLVLSVGYVVNYFGIEGMALHSHNMYTIADAIKLRHAIVGAIRGREQNQSLHFTVIGAGPTGVELAADLQNFARIIEQKHNLKHIPIHVNIVEAADRLLPILSKESSAVALRRMHEVGVDVHLDTRAFKATSTSLETNHGLLQSDIIIWTAGNKANPLFAAYEDCFTLAKNGRVQVNEFFQAKKDDIFVVGDAAQTPYSGMAQTAIHNGVALADNLKKLVNSEQMKAYEPIAPAYSVPIGGDWAILEEDGKITTGAEGWRARRRADKWALENFLVYELADKHYQQGERLADF